MRLLIDVLDANGNRLGPGPISSAQGVTVTRELDGVGSLFVSVPVADRRALDLLTNERRIRVWGWDAPGSDKRLIASGIVRNFDYNASEGGDRAGFSGPDQLDELKRVNTWLGWMRSQHSVKQTAEDLIGLAAGWTIDTASIAFEPGALSVRFDGASVLKALQSVVQQRGLHLRWEAEHRLAVGAFGDDSGLRVAQVGHAPPDLLQNDNLLLLDTLTMTYDSEDVVNRIMVLGPGDGEAALTLKNATRTGPYTVKAVTKNGIVQYYLEDETSIAQYGVIERVFQANDIAALSNTDADLVAAANALYDLAAAWLARNAVRQEVYKVTVQKARATILPGQTVRVDYRGWAVDAQGNRVKWVTVNQNLWVVRAAERIGLEASSVDLSLSTVDKVPGSAANIVISALENLRVQGMVVKPYLSKDTINPPAEAIDASHPVTFPFSFGAYTAKLNQVILRVRTRPFRTLASGGDHKHVMFVNDPNWPTSWPSPTVGHFVCGDDAASFAYTNIQTGSTKDMYTYGGSGDLEFGIADDTETPAGITLTVDGKTVASDLAPSGGEVDFEKDITDQFSETGFQGSHSITVSCDSGQGLVIGEIEVRETIQSIAAVGGASGSSTGPTCLISSPDADPVSGAFTVTIGFSKSVTGFEVGDITVTNGAASALVDSGDGLVFSASITPSGADPVTVAVDQAVCEDLDGRPNRGSNTLTREII